MFKQLHIIIVDDEPLARLRLSQLCEDIQDTIDNKIVAQYAHASALVNQLPKLSHQFNLQIVPTVILLDINMPDLNGIALASFLQTHTPYIKVIFITAEPQHALEAFNVSAIDYILKPVRIDRLLTAFKKAIHSIQTPIEAHITVHLSCGTATALAVSNIIYFKADNKLTLVCTKQTLYTCHLSLNELEHSLNIFEKKFIRIHRNALINCLFCGHLDENQGINGIRIKVLGLDRDEYLKVSRRMLANLRGNLIK